MEQLIKQFKKLGEKIEPRNNRPLYLKDSNLVYIVTRGVINLFSVDFKDGKPGGSRIHIINLPENKLFIGVNHHQAGTSRQFLVVGNPGTEVYCLNKQVFASYLENPDYSRAACQMMEEWINQFIHHVFMPLQAVDYIDVTGKEPLNITKGKQLMSREQFLWVRHLKGKSYVLDSQQLEITGDMDFPISDILYLTAADDVEIIGQSCDELLKDRRLWTTIDRIYYICMEQIVQSRKEYLDLENQRLKKRSQLKEISLKKGVVKLANILQSKRKGTILEQFVEDDALLGTCKIIGKHLNINFTLPPRLDEDMDDKDKLQEIVRASHIKMRKVLLDINWWDHDNGPLLAFNKENGHPIALIPKSAKKYQYIDLVDKEILVANETTTADLEDFAYCFYRPFPDKSLSWWDLVKHGTFRNSWDIVFVLIIGVAGALLGLLHPYLTGILFDRVIPAASMGELNQMIYILISCTLAITMFEITKSIAVLRFEGKMDRDVQSALWDRLLSLPVPFFKKYTAGDLANRSLGIDGMRQILSGVAVQSILTGIFSVFYCIQLFYYNFTLGLIGLGLGLLIMFIALIIGYMYVRYQMPVLEIEGRISGMVLQFINGISKLRTTGMEDYAFQHWANKFSEKKKLAFKAGLSQCTLMTVNSIFPLFASMVIFAYVVYQLDSSVFSIGDFAAYSSAYALLQNALLQMAIYLTSSLSILPVYRRFKPIITAEPEVDDTKARPQKMYGNIDIQNINFRYASDGPLVLKNLSLEIKSGEFAAIVGQSGSGKSTLTRSVLFFLMDRTYPTWTSGKYANKLAWFYKIV
jgi:ATP-binding cassette subfamily C protein